MRSESRNKTHAYRARLHFGNFGANVRVLRTLLVIVIVFSLCACMGQSGQTGQQLTPQEQARADLDRIQGQLRVWWDSAKQWHDLNPQKDQVWYRDIVPLFSDANHAILEAELRGGSLDTSFIDTAVRPIINRITGILIREGVIK